MGRQARLPRSNDRTGVIVPRTIRTSLIVGVLVALFAAEMATATPAEAVRGDAPVVSIELVGDEGTRFVVGDRPYAGPIIVTAHRDGVALTERATIEQYLRGIAEMPFLWDEEALAALVTRAFWRH